MHFMIALYPRNLSGAKLPTFHIIVYVATGNVLISNSLTVRESLGITQEAQKKRELPTMMTRSRYLALISH